MRFDSTRRRGAPKLAAPAALLLLASCLFSACSSGRDDNLKGSKLPSGEGGVDSGSIDPVVIADGSLATPDAEVPALDGEVSGSNEDAALGADDASAPDALILPYCGNGNIDEGEGCDDGDANSDSEPDACRKSCQPARCGDHVIDGQEACDDGDANSDSEPNACRATCVRPRCGDGVRDMNEGCDTGATRSDSEPGACRTNCTLARCGDSVTDPGEGCDDGNSNDTDSCRNDCTSPKCGDGTTDPGEECDDNNNTSGDGCQATCRLPRCGDGVRDSGEQCDDGNTANNDGCRNDCRTGCINRAACDDSQFCNGPEQCVDGLCRPGTAPSTNDGVACTDDRCDEASDTIIHAPNTSLCAQRPPECTNAVRTTHNISCTPSGCVDAPSTSACADQPTTCTNLADGTIALDWYSPMCTGSSCGLAHDQNVCRAGTPSCNANTRVGTTYPPTCDAAGTRCGTRAVTDSCSRLDTGTCVQGNFLAYQNVVRGACNSSGGCDAVRQPDEDCRRPSICSNGQLTSYRPSCTNGVGCGAGTPSTGACYTAPARCDYDVNKQLNYYSYTAACADGSSCVANGSEQITPCRDGATTCGPVTTGAPFGSVIPRIASCSLTGRCSTTLGTAVPCPRSSPICSTTDTRTIIHRSPAGCREGLGCTWTQTDTSQCTAFCSNGQICSEACAASPNGAGCSACRSCGPTRICRAGVNGGPASCVLGGIIGQGGALENVVGN